MVAETDHLDDAIWKKFNRFIMIMMNITRDSKQHRLAFYVKKMELGTYCSYNWWK